MHGAVRKAQAAMEYMITYGWALLLIAVAVGVLYEFGVFSSSNFIGKASPGSCMVVRPNGPFTVDGDALSGVCTELPEEVAEFDGNPTYISTPAAALENATNFTIAFWVDPRAASGQVMYEEDVAQCPLLEVTESPLELNVSNAGTWVSANSMSALATGTWQFVVVTLSDGGPSKGTASFYVNSQFVTAAPSQSESTTGGALKGLIGGVSLCHGISGAFNGSIANVQLYNASLSQQGVTALYEEGLGGAPIDLSNLVAWWPLNENANDYGGNGFDGNSTYAMFTNAWTHDYHSTI